MLPAPTRHQTLVFVSVTAILLLASTHCHAQTYTWSAPADGSWADGTNWGCLTADYPRTMHDTARFSSHGNDSARTVTLDAAITVGALRFGPTQTGAVTLSPGSGGSLTLAGINPHHRSLTVNTASGDHAITADVTLAGCEPHQWRIGADRTFTVSGSIGGNAGLTKTGAGTLLLNGTSTYAGPTKVSAGTFGGAGSILGRVTVGARAAIAAGTSAAAPSLTLGNGLTLKGEYRVTLFSPTAVSRLVVSSGSVSLAGGSLELALGPGVTVADFRAAGPRSFTVIDAANGQLSGTFSTTNFAAAGFAASEWTVGYNAASGNAVLNFTPVPEPTVVLGAAAAALLAGWAVRRAGVRRSVIPIG